MTRTVPLQRAACLVALLLIVLALSARGAAPAGAATWVWPLAGPQEVARPFAPGPERWDPGHRGADLPGEPGQPVRAAGAGRVSYAGLLAGRGVVVVVHGALRTTYEPVRAQVAVGAPIGAGEQLGTLEPGHAGCPVAACLHWGLLRGETYLDPVRLVRGGPVRLLPREGGGLPPAAAAPLPAARAADGVGQPGSAVADPDPDVVRAAPRPADARAADGRPAGGQGPGPPAPALAAAAGLAVVAGLVALRR